VPNNKCWNINGLQFYFSSGGEKWIAKLRELAEFASGVRIVAALVNLLCKLAATLVMECAGRRLI